MEIKQISSKCNHCNKEIQINGNSPLICKDSCTECLDMFVKQARENVDHYIIEIGKKSKITYALKRYSYWFLILGPLFLYVQCQFGDGGVILLAIGYCLGILIIPITNWLSDIF